MQGKGKVLKICKLCGEKTYYNPCRKCTTETRRVKEGWREPTHCIDCGKTIAYRATRCRKCDNEHRKTLPRKIKPKKYCIDCGAEVTVGPRCRKCRWNAIPLNPCSKCGKLSKRDPCMKCTMSKRKNPPRLCEDCGEDIQGKRWCKSCAAKHQKEYKRGKTCSVCGETCIQNPCYTCSALLSWEDNEDRKAWLSKRQERLWSDPEYRKRNSQGIADAWNEERKEYYRELRKEFWTDEMREYFSRTHTERWADPDFRAKMDEINSSPEVRQRKAEAAAKVQRKRFNTSIEIKTKAVLTQLDVSFKFQYPLGGKVYDFYIPQIQLLIEVDGDYWHSLPENIENDAIKNQIAEDYGLKLVRFSESDINSIGAHTLITEHVLPLLDSQNIIDIVETIPLF